MSFFRVFPLSSHKVVHLICKLHFSSGSASPHIPSIHHLHHRHHNDHVNVREKPRGDYPLHREPQFDTAPLREVYGSEFAVHQNLMMLWMLAFAAVTACCLILICCGAAGICGFGIGYGLSTQKKREKVYEMVECAVDF